MKKAIFYLSLSLNALILLVVAHYIFIDDQPLSPEARAEMEVQSQRGLRALASIEKHIGKKVHPDQVYSIKRLAWDLGTSSALSSDICQAIYSTAEVKHASQ